MTRKPDSRESKIVTDTLTAAGAVASGVAVELVRPLRDLRERLAVMVETLDRHVTEADGPDPLSWHDIKAFREDVAKAYLDSRAVTRLASELADAVGHTGQVPELVDVNKLVETALNLARHRIAADTEVFIDFGAMPQVRAIPGRIVLGVAQLILISADSARGVDGGAISIKTRRDRDPEQGIDEIAIYVADNGSGRPEGIAAAEGLVSHIAESMGGVFEGTAEPDTGSVFELRLPVAR